MNRYAAIACAALAIVASSSAFAPVAHGAAVSSPVPAAHAAAASTPRAAISLDSLRGYDSLQSGKLVDIAWHVDDLGALMATTSVDASATSTPDSSATTTLDAARLHAPTVDIRLVPMGALASTSPYIATGLDPQSGRYTWQIGNVLSYGTTSMSAMRSAVSDGRYLVRVCISGTGICDTSREPVTIYTILGVQSPVITTVNGPTSVPVGQPATWVIHAYDPQNQRLAYIVSWDDGTSIAFSPSDPELGAAYENGVAVTHTYMQARTFDPTFTVRDRSGLTTVNSMAVYTRYPTPDDALVSR